MSEVPVHTYRHRGCKCEPCRAIRREYDRGRDRRIRDGRKRLRGWYVCLGKWGATYAEHEYSRVGVCIRCGADRPTEEHWEREWEKS